ncbi:ABC transporter permease [Pseudanabaena sp. FACHB-1998]|uniref:ABC transporter permease n=1 Tax=Pseudanabaena sp. FACHB-1998 TaxID=2692858 RepID=UPI001680595B|nr:ABC transporter permease [Pseudanabaena sp. FACHB-1998]MBD2179289.1 ABC transporter permease [Pseudanabaena sp. FACHB-1998]
MLTIRSHIIEAFLAIILSLILIGASESIIGVDVARTLLGTKPSQAEVVALERELGLDRPFFERLLVRTVKAFQGDLGESYTFRQPVTPLLISSASNSLKLVLPSLLIGGVLGTILGIVVAYYPKQGKFLLTVGASFALLPSLVLSTLVVYGLGFQLGWIKPSYSVAVVLLSLVPLFIVALTVYQEYVQILSSNYTRASRSWGFPEWQVALYSLKVAAVALVTSLTNLLLYLLTATVFIEISFSLPGLGTLLLNATERLDYPIITGISFAIVLVFSLMNVLSAITLYALDPRTR